MRRSIIVFLVGFICGALSLDLLCMNALRVQKSILRYNLSGEQELLSRRAERESNYMRALVHRWNAVDALSEDGFRVFRPELARKYGDGLLFPFKAMVIRQKLVVSQKQQRFNEGIQRAQLAFTMEKVGMREAAEEQWNMATQLSSVGVDELRELVLKTAEFYNSEQSMEGERQVLED